VSRHLQLGFPVELSPAPLAELFARPEVIPGLVRARALVTLAIPDFSRERRDVVRALNRAGVPVTAWMLVDDADGYWLTADNHALALARYRELYAWAQREQLQFARVGLDIEAPIADSRALVARGLRALPELLRRMRSRAQVQAARSAYTQLIELIRSDGYLAETYHLPFMADARLQKSMLLERVLGVVDVRGDRDALMLYSNLSQDRAAKALIDVYGPHAGAIAVGITGGGVEDVLVKVERRLLDYDAVVHEMRRAFRYCDEVQVFSLEGCVAGGFFERLCHTELTVDPSPPAGWAVLKLKSYRAVLQALLRLGELIP